MIQLGSTNSGDHPDVGAGVLEPGREWRDEILDKVGDTERTEAAEREAADGGVLIAAVPLEEVDCEQREVRVCARVGADVEVAHLLGDDVGGGGAEHHLPERGRHVDAGRHAGDHPLEDVAALVIRIGRAAPRELPQLLLQIGHLALPALNRVTSWRVSLGFERREVSGAGAGESGAPGRLGRRCGLRRRRDGGSHGGGRPRRKVGSGLAWGRRRLRRAVVFRLVGKLRI